MGYILTAMNGNGAWNILVRTQGHLDDWVSDYLGAVNLRRMPDGTTVITGTAPDTPALYGFILRLRDGGIPLVSLQADQTVPHEEDSQ